MKSISLALLCLFGVVAVAFSQSQRSPQPRLISPPRNPFDQALILYSEWTGRTILRPGNLPAAQKEFDLQKLPSDTDAVATFIESELRQRGITFIPDGKLFVWVVPVGWTNSPEAKFISTLKPPLPEKEVVHAGSVSYASATADQVLAMYCELRGRTLIRPLSLAYPMLYLKNQQSMTRNELSYAITVLLALNGIAAVEDGEKFMQIWPVGMVSQAVTHAPKPATNAVVLDPKELPKFKPEYPTARMRQLNELYGRFFHDTPPWTPRPLNGLAEFYADLTDQTFVPSKTVDGLRKILFEVKTPLTKEELVYAIETLLRLEGLEIGNVGKNKFSLFPLGTKARSDKEKKPAAEKR